MTKREREREAGTERKIEGRGWETQRLRRREDGRQAVKEGGSKGERGRQKDVTGRETETPRDWGERNDRREMLTPKSKIVKILTMNNCKP